jgi:hypothetical protein
LGILFEKFWKKIDLGYIKIDLMRKGQRIGDRSKKLGFVSLRLMFVCLDLGVVRGEQLVGRPGLVRTELLSSEIFVPNIAYDMKSLFTHYAHSFIFSCML